MFVPTQYYFPCDTFAPIASPKVETQQRSRFTKDEDELLKKLAESQNNPKWNEIALYLKGRTARQCRERYNNYLRPNLINGPWTPEEDEMLLELFEKHGPKWALIARSFNSRSPVNVKNRHSTLASHSSPKNSKAQQQEIVESKIKEETVSVNESMNYPIAENESEPNFTANDDFENMLSNFEICDDLWSSPIVPLAEDDLLSF